MENFSNTKSSSNCSNVEGEEADCMHSCVYCIWENYLKSLRSVLQLISLK